MKKISLTVFTVVCAISMAFGIMLMTNATKANADSIEVDGTVPILSDVTYYKISADSNKSGLIIATGIKDYQDTYEVGYEGLPDGTNARHDSKTGYYTAIKSGDYTWTAQELFGEGYDGMIVWEIEYNRATEYTVKAYAKHGRRVDGKLAKYDPEKVVYGKEKSVPIEKFTVTFKNYDGSELQSGSDAYGTTPVYTGETPVRAADAAYTYTFNGWTPAIDTVTGNVSYTAAYTKTLNDVVDFSNDDIPTDMFDSYANQTVTLDKENGHVRIVTNGAGWNGDGGVVINYGRMLAVGTKIAITYKVTAETNGDRFVIVKNNGNWEWDYSTVKVNDYSDFVTYAFKTAYVTDSIKLIVPGVAATYDIKKLEILSSLADETVTMLDFTDSANNKATTATYLAQGGTLVSDATFGTVTSFKFGRNNDTTVSINRQNGFVFATPIVLSEGDKLSIVYNSTMTDSNGIDILINGTNPTGIYSGYVANTWKTFTYTAPAGGKTINSLGFAHWKDSNTYVMKIAGIMVNNATNAKAIAWTKTDNSNSITYSVDFSEWTALNSCSNITYNSNAASIISADVGGKTKNVLCTGINTNVMKTYFDFSDLDLSGKQITFRMTMKLPVATNTTNCDMYVGNSWVTGNYNGQWMTTEWKTISETFTVANGDTWTLYRQGGAAYAWDQQMYIASIEIIVNK